MPGSLWLHPNATRENAVLGPAVSGRKGVNWNVPPTHSQVSLHKLNHCKIHNGSLAVTYYIYCLIVNERFERVCKVYQPSLYYTEQWTDWGKKLSTSIESGQSGNLVCIPSSAADLLCDRRFVIAPVCLSFPTCDMGIMISLVKHFDGWKVLYKEVQF